MQGSIPGQERKGKKEKVKNNTYQHKIEEYHNWNFALNVASGAFDNFALSLVGTTTVLAAFLTLFTKSNLVIGLVPALFVFFWTFPQIVSPLYTSHLRQKKNTIVFVKVGYALPWLALSILTLFIIKPGSKLSLPVFFVLYSLFALLGGFVVPTWISFISRLIFPNARGKFFALRYFVATSFAFLASFIVKGILDLYEYPLNFSLIFLLAFSMFLLATIFLGISKEPLAPYQIRKKNIFEYFSELGNTVRRDKNFGWFIVSLIIRSFGVIIMAVVFYTVYAIDELHVSFGKVGVFMSIMYSSQLIVALFLGRISDLKGPRIVQIFSRLFEFLSAGVILLRPDITGVYIAFGFLGLASASMNVSYSNMIMALAPREKADTYTGLINGIRAPSLAIAPLVGGFLADSFSYQTVFMVALFSCLFSGLILFLKVKMPGEKMSFGN